MSAPLTFVEMLRTLGLDGTFTQSEIARVLGVSPSHISDLLKGRRLPSVSLVNRICDYKGRGPAGRLEWHLAAARAHGWEV